MIFVYGITPELLTKIFELFSQLTSSLEKSDGGLGIGLSLVKRLVELHGGSVQAYSEGKGRGSEFVVRLPVETLDMTASAYKN
jgi:signal transduction histidine kinase